MRLVASDILPLEATLVSVLTVPLLTLTLWLRTRLCRGTTDDAGGGVAREWRREAAAYTWSSYIWPDIVGGRTGLVWAGLPKQQLPVYRMSD